jgi:hypothetical protein
MTSVVSLLINKYSISLIKVTESMASTFIYMLDSTQDPGIHSMESLPRLWYGFLSGSISLIYTYCLETI